MKAKAFTAINVTIPYKQAVLPFLDEISDEAKAIGAVNTILNRDGKLYGYNTDYLGFLYTLQKNNIKVTGEKVLVLGNGGAAKAIVAIDGSKGSDGRIIRASYGTTKYCTT